MSYLDHSLNPLDGDAVAYPDRCASMALYRTFWLSWLWANTETRAILQVAMDGEQRKITKGHGPLWMTFCKTLPGHAEFWAKQVQDLQMLLDRNTHG